MRVGLRIFLGYFVIVALAALLLAQVFVAQVKPGVRQAMEDTLVDTANLLAELAANDLIAGHMDDGQFARAVRDLRGRDFGAQIWGFDKRQSQYRIYVTDVHGIVVFDSSGRDVGRDFSRWNDVYLTLHGRYGARSTLTDPNDPDSSVMHVAAPIRNGDRLIGVLTVAKPNRALAPFIARSQRMVMRAGWLLLGAALLVGVIAAWWLSRQLLGLRRYAHAVTAGERATLPRSAGEFAELGQALETMRQKLEGKQYVEQYVHALTHEMKSPLAAINASAELLETDLPAAERIRFAASVRSQGERLAQMVDKLLALAAVEHRQALEHPGPIVLRTLVNEIVEAVGLRLAQAGLELSVEGDSNLPPVHGDRFLLGQAIGNLVDNAIDFAPPGSALRISLLADGRGQRIDVLDGGSGVPDYALGRVFERFYSLPRPAGGSRSSGLGLCFVAEVASLHGGHAGLANRGDGGGAIASLWLPAD